MKNMIFYKDFQWQQEDFIIQGLPLPRPCPHCGYSPVLYSDEKLYYIECSCPQYIKRLDRPGYDESLEICGYNHYTTTEVKRTIDLWNKYDAYYRVNYEELSDVHYYLIHREYPE